MKKLPPASSLTTGLENFTKTRIILKQQLNIFDHFSCLGFLSWKNQILANKKSRDWLSVHRIVSSVMIVTWRNCSMPSLCQGPSGHLPSTCEMGTIPVRSFVGIRDTQNRIFLTIFQGSPNRTPLTSPFLELYILPITKPITSKEQRIQRMDLMEYQDITQGQKVIPSPKAVLSLARARGTRRVNSNIR